MFRHEVPLYTVWKGEKLLTSNHDDGRNNCEEKIYGHDLPPPCRRGGHQASLGRSPLSLHQLGQALLWPHLLW